MSAVPETLRPEDNAELLLVAEQLDDRNENQASAKRNLVRAFLRSPLLLAGGLESPLVLPSTETGVFTAFTDEEAAEAWSAARHPDAPPARWELVPPDENERAARLTWLDRLEASRAAVISVNPSGPMSFLVFHHEINSWRLRFQRSKAEPGAAPWLDLEDRSRERARLQGLMERMADVVVSGEVPRMEALDAELKTRRDFASFEIDSTFLMLIARWRLHFEQYYNAIYELTWLATMRARTGDPWRAVDAFLEAADHIRRLSDEGVEDPEHPGFLEYYWSYVVQALPVITVPYREAERAALVENQPTFPPRRRGRPQR